MKQADLRDIAGRIKTVADAHRYAETIGEMPCESCGLWTEARAEELGPGILMFCYYCPACGHEVAIEREEWEEKKLRRQRFWRKLFRMEKRYRPDCADPVESIGEFSHAD